jgi:hypothetical protein
VHNLSTVALLEGQPYYVTVVAWNGAGPPLSSNASSWPVIVDTTGPEAGMVFNTFDYKQASSTPDARSLQASWDDFTDPQSNVTGYVVAFFQQVSCACACAAVQAACACMYMPGHAAHCIRGLWCVFVMCN